MSDTDKKSFLQNVEIYIGDDPDNYLNNQLCSGGPYLDIDDPKNYCYDPHPDNTGNLKPWVYGIEVWCNLEGRYTHIRANVAHQAGNTFTQAICNLSIFGSRYIRRNDLPSEIDYTLTGEERGEILVVEHIYADPDYPIGNQLEIQLR